MSSRMLGADSVGPPSFFIADYEFQHTGCNKFNKMQVCRGSRPKETPASSDQSLPHKKVVNSRDVTNSQSDWKQFFLRNLVQNIPEPMSQAWIESCSEPFRNLLEPPASHPNHTWNFPESNLLQNPEPARSVKSGSNLPNNIRNLPRPTQHLQKPARVGADPNYSLWAISPGVIPNSVWGTMQAKKICAHVFFQFLGK